MGAFLDKPRTEKSNESGNGAGLHYGIASMQGWRIEMEDAHTARAGDEMPTPWTDWAFFAVFDGHAGYKVARYSSHHLLDAIVNSYEMQELAKHLPLESSKLDTKQIESITRAMKTSFLSLDEKMRASPELWSENERSGSTAVCALVAPSHIFIANLGDSRALISRNGGVHLATDDHKPYLPKERDRILKAGGSVMIQRVNGSLAVSRAFGDFEYKSVPGLGAALQMVSPEPDVHVIERDSISGQSGKDEFLLLACDGVFDVMNNHEVCDFIRSRLRVTDRLDLICNQIMDSCLSKGSKDNMSIILVTFAGAPKVCTEAVDKERELESRLKERIQNIVQSSLCSDDEDVEPEQVLRLLMEQEIPGAPPGAGLHAMRALVVSELESMNEKTSETNSSDNEQLKQKQRRESSPPAVVTSCSLVMTSPTSPARSPPKLVSDSSPKSTTADESGIC